VRRSKGFRVLGHSFRSAAMVLVEELPEESEIESEDESGPELDPDSDSQVFYERRFENHVFS
jgi:hypothetical protein